MGSFTFALCVILIDYGANSFSVPTGFKTFQPISFLQTKSDPDVFPLKENTVTDLGLKLAKILTKTNAKDCLKTCQKTEGCLRVVHCKIKNKCDPGTFCLMKDTSTCYLAAKTGRLLEPTGTCTFTKEVHPKGNGFQADEKALSPFNAQAESRILPMDDQKTTEEIVPKESLKMDGVLRIKTSENQNELVVNESAKVNGFSLKLHSETFGKLVGHESVKEDRISVNSNHDNVDEIGSQGSPNVDGISDNVEYDNLDKTLSKDSQKEDGSSGKNDLGMVDITASQESSIVDGLSDNIKYDNLDVTDKNDIDIIDIKASQESSNVDGLSDNVDYDNLDETLSTDSQKVDGISDKIDLDMVDITASQVSSNVDGITDDIDYGKLDQRVSKDSLKVDNISDNTDLDMVDITASQVSSNVDGISDIVDYDKLDQRVSQDSPNVDGILDITDLDRVDITASQVFSSVDGITDDIDYGKLDQRVNQDSAKLVGISGNDEKQNISRSQEYPDMDGIVLGIDPDMLNEKVSENSPIVDGIPVNIDYDRLNKPVSHKSSKRGGIVGSINNEKLGESPKLNNISWNITQTTDNLSGNISENLVESPKAGDLSGNITNRFNKSVSQLSQTAGGLLKNISEKMDKAVSEKVGSLSGNISSTQAGLVNHESLMSEALSGNFTTEKSSGIVTEGKGNQEHLHVAKKDKLVRQESFKDDGSLGNSSMTLNDLENAMDQLGSDAHDSNISDSLLSLVDTDTSQKPNYANTLKNESTFKSVLQNQTNLFDLAKGDNSGTNKPQESRIPEECQKEPTYVNQGAVRKRKFNRPGYPVVIEYECDETAKEKYKYLAGPREALCDANGTWTLPAMFCNPTSCFSRVADSPKTVATLYGGDAHQDKAGRECQAWVKNEPHSHNVFTGYCYGCGTVQHLGNRCRDADSAGKPWCYTMDPSVRWKFCDVPECAKETTCSRPPYLRSAPALRTMVVGRNVHVTHRCHPDLKYLSGRNASICDMETGVWEWSDLLCSSENCFHYDHQWRKMIYHGKESTTKTGKICQRWDSQFPQQHTKKVSEFPGATHLSELGNLCRDPDREGAPWCYTTNPTSRWEFCSVPECNLST